MLRSSRNRLRIALCPDRVAIVQLAGGPQPRLLSKQVQTCDAADAGWEPSIEVLESVLAEGNWGKGDATVVLSNHFMRYLIQPWSDVALSDAEQMALVAHRFAEVYGTEAAANWEFRLSQGALGAAAVASAVPRELPARLRALFKSSPLRLRSVQPYLMTAFNACRNELDGEAAGFVLAERGVFCAGLLRDGQWSGIRLRRSTDDWLDEALQLLEREALLSSDVDGAGKVYVCAPDAPAAAEKRGDWEVRPLKPGLPPEFVTRAEIANYAMAAVGALQ